MPVLSATDCITPAFRHTTRQMFRPFRFSFWVRLAVLGVFTGEFSGGGFRGNLPTGFPHQPATSGGAGRHVPFPWHAEWFTPTHIFEVALAIALFVIVFTVIFVYINSILRFVLFDAVLHGNARIVDGWRKWRGIGRKYFVWQLLLAIVGWGVLLSCVVVPLLMLFSSHHIGFWHIDALAIVVLVLSGLTMMLLGIALAIIAILAKDFVVPIMALEGVGWQEGWRRFHSVARGYASEYVIYFLMKFVLRIGAGIAHGILLVMLIFILAIPAAMAVVIGVAVATGATTVVKALLITIGILGALLLLMVVIAFSALVGAPIAFFFPAYSIYFFAGRYTPLGAIVFPAPPPPPNLAPPAGPSPVPA